jgi:hypothetical protein
MKKLDLSGIASPPPKFEARPPRPEPEKKPEASKSDFEIPPLRFTKGQEPEFNWRPLSYYDDRAINSFFEYYYSKVGNAKNEEERAKWGPSLAALMNEQDRRKRESASSAADSMQKASEAFTAMGRAMGKSSIGNDMVDTLRGYYGVSAGSGIAIDSDGLRMAYPEPDQTNKDEVVYGGDLKEMLLRNKAEARKARLEWEIALGVGDRELVVRMGGLMDELNRERSSLEKQLSARDLRNKRKKKGVFDF